MGNSIFLRAIAFFKKEYGGHIPADLMAGVTTGVVALPLALAFALASGVEAKYGLFTAIVTGIVAGIFGGSKVQVTGPTGGMAAILISVTTQFGYEKVVIIALFAGLFQIIAGALKLGRFAKMLPYPLILGFTIGIAVVVLGGQFDHALGISVHHHETEFFARMLETFQAARILGPRPAALGLALGTILCILGINRISNRLPSALISIILSGAVAWAFDLNVAYLSGIPTHLPAPRFPDFSWSMTADLLRPAAIVAALGGIESLLAAVVADGVLNDGSKHEPNRELVGQGLANMAASFFGGIPGTGAIARTAVNVKSGAKTRLAAVFHSVFLLAAMLLFAPWASRIPIAALAGVLMLTAIQMIEWAHLRWLLRGPRSDITILGVTILVTVFTDLVMAVEFGLAAAGILFIKKMSEIVPQMIPVEAIDGPSSHSKGMRIFKIPGPLFWGDSHAIFEAIDQCDQTQAVILKMQHVNHIDASGIAMLRETRARLKQRGMKLLLVGAPESALKIMTRMGLIDEVGAQNVFDTLEAAKDATKGT